MGEANFTGWFGKGNFPTELERRYAYKNAMKIAYILGVRGFSISPHATLMRTLKKFKCEHPDVICISNHHRKLNYYIDKTSLWEPYNISRIKATVLSKLDPRIIASNCPWLNDVDSQKPFSEEEIDKITLNEVEYRKNLTQFSKFCDYALIGNIGPTGLFLMGRIDLLEHEIEIVRDEGLVPIGMCQGGGLVLPGMDRLKVGGHWLYINKSFSFPNLEYTLKIIKKIKKPITAYKIFSDSKIIDIESSLKFLKEIRNIKSIVFGTENEKQIGDDCTKIRNIFMGKMIDTIRIICANP